MVSLLDPVRLRADAAPGSVAVRDAGEHVSYEGLLESSLRFASILDAQGVAAGERVVLIAPSVPAYVVAYLGIQAAGCVVVPMNTMSTSEEVSYVVRDAQASLIIAWHEASVSARKAADTHRLPVVTLVHGMWEDLPLAPPTDRDPDDTAAILYTSGTTGRPKGAELTVANILSAAQISVECSHGTADDRIGTGLPLFHIFGQISVMMASLTAGSSLCLVAPFSPEAMIDAIRTHRLTIVAGVPTMWNAMLRSSRGEEGSGFGSIRLAVSGGAPLPTPVAHAFESRFGCELLEGYGLTETTSQGTFNDQGGIRKSGSAGRPVPRTSVEVRCEKGLPLGPGDVGEIHISGPSVMKGYWRRPEATAQALSDGWLRTGDLGMVDQDGDLFIVDRLKDLIIRGGYNVYPGEVEEILYEHPHIVEAAVVGVPDEHYGQEVAAAIVLDQSASVTGPEITEWARERMSAYKIPRLVRFVESLPKGPSGKILKRTIDTDRFRQPASPPEQAP
ncbi:AMP-binding protein [Streptomyces sp. NPDC056296]|uniref:AMP-binding protein n=1 Tax=Streptomyces sp. NPDC056296 TaxID=3345775 RepID=UPI0035DE4B24